jgi:hypothetical protein
MVGTASIETAISKANSLSPRGVYRQLRTNLPAETQTYLKRVFTRRAYYAAWRGEGERVFLVPPARLDTEIDGEDK